MSLLYQNKLSFLLFACISIPSLIAGKQPAKAFFWDSREGQLRMQATLECSPTS